MLLSDDERVCSDIRHPSLAWVQNTVVFRLNTRKFLHFGSSHPNNKRFYIKTFYIINTLLYKGLRFIIKYITVNRYFF